MADAEDKAGTRLPLEFADLTDVIQTIRDAKDAHPYLDHNILAGQLMNVARRMEADSALIERRSDEVARIAIANGELALLVVQCLIDTPRKEHLALIGEHFRNIHPDKLGPRLSAAVEELLRFTHDDEQADAWAGARS